MSKILDKFLGVIGVETEDEEIVDETEIQQFRGKDNMTKSKKSNLLGLPSQRQVTMILLKAKSDDEIETIAQHLKERRSVIVSFEEVDKETAQRVIDFLSGAIFSLDGTVQKVSTTTFLFATSNIDVVGQISEEEKTKTLFNCISQVKK